MNLPSDVTERGVLVVASSPIVLKNFAHCDRTAKGDIFDHDGDTLNILILEDVASIEGPVDKRGYPRDRAVVTTKTGDDVCGKWKNGLR